MNMKTSNDGINFLKEREGSRASLYDDRSGKPIKKASLATGNPTIGVGHLVRRRDTSYDGVTLTNEEINTLLEEDLNTPETILNKIINDNGIKLTQAQFDMLVSFIFNVGVGNSAKDGFMMLRSGRPSTMCRCLMDGNLVGVAAEFPKWCKASGVVVEGLRKRRLAEQEIFLNGYAV